MKGMTVKHSRSIVRLPIVAALVFAALIIAGVAGAQPAVTVVMSNLDNPRGLVFAPNGALSRHNGTELLRPDRRGEPLLEGPPGPGRDRPALDLVSARCAGARAARHLDAWTG